jgi:hypothetical protein
MKFLYIVFLNYSNLKFHENLFKGLFPADVQTDKMKLTVTFRKILFKYPKIRNGL